jgi:hypothetical protein
MVRTEAPHPVMQPTMKSRGNELRMIYRSSFISAGVAIAKTHRLAKFSVVTALGMTAQRIPESQTDASQSCQLTSATVATLLAGVRCRGDYPGGADADYLIAAGNRCGLG